MLQVCKKCHYASQYWMEQELTVRVKNVVRMGIEILNVPQKSICNLRAHILTGLDTLLKLSHQEEQRSWRKERCEVRQEE